MKGDRFIKSKNTVLNVDDIVTANFEPEWFDVAYTNPPMKRLSITVRGYKQHIFWAEEAQTLWNQLQQLDTTWDELMPQ